MTRPKVGQFVVFEKLPDWVRILPANSRKIFEFCRGKPYRIVEVDANGMLVLDVSADVDQRFGGRFNDLRIEPQYVRPSK